MPPEHNEEPDSTVTPYEVEGRIDYDRLLEEFGAQRLTEVTIADFPDPVPPLLRRGFYYAGRDIDRILEAAHSGRTISIVTGVGPSGPLHIGHALHLFVARYLQDAVGARVYIPISDDEKHWTSDRRLPELRAIARENVRDIIGIGFDPALTRIVIDTEDADVVYPAAASFAGDITSSEMRAVYGKPETVGMGFYPAVQSTHLLLPQLVHGPHPTLVPVSIDQDPHIRVARDIAAKERYPVTKPAALLGRFLPSLDGPGKMSSSGDETIALTDDRATVRDALADAYSGGQSSIDAHREHGGDPSQDVAFQYLRLAFEPEDRSLARIERSYRSGSLLSGELKAYAAEQITAKLAEIQDRRPDGDLEQALDPFRLTPEERYRARRAILGDEPISPTSVANSNESTVGADTVDE